MRGIDDEGREVLTFIEGDDGRHVRHSEQTLALAGKLVRRFHDAVQGFRPPPDAVWRRTGSADESSGRLIICHHDLAPYNTIYRQGRPTAFIDWDLAGPAPALADVAHAAWSFVPLYPDEVCVRIGLPVLPRGPRLREFCDGYGLQERESFLDAVRTHLVAHTSPTAQRSVPYLDSMRKEWQAHLA
ncbi:phosphotransferase [Actinopolymorpha sp. B17G11]|uniref:phosphotransferase n=1 Tax=Actinopolymorpha sp. B17G11 TaxID=3160861 RepID=UPI0032E4B1CB